MQHVASFLLFFFLICVISSCFFYLVAFHIYIFFFFMENNDRQIRIIEKLASRILRVCWIGFCLGLMSRNYVGCNVADIGRFLKGWFRFLGTLLQKIVVEIENEIMKMNEIGCFFKSYSDCYFAIMKFILKVNSMR